MNPKWLLLPVTVTLFATGAVSNTDRCAGLPDGRFLTNFQQCNAFFSCFRGESIPGECPEGYVFSEAEQLCDFPWNVMCLICPENGDVPTLEPIDGQCSFYTLCLDGIGFRRECAEGYLFDAVQGACFTAEEAQCDIGVCPSNLNPNVPVNLPNPIDCSQYFICLGGVAEPRQCAPTLLFDPIAQRCDVAENVECVEGSIPSPTTCPPTGLHLIGNPANCNSYFVCLNGVQNDVPVECAPTLIFDITDSMCRTPTEDSRCADGSNPLPEGSGALGSMASAQRNPCQGVADGMFVSDLQTCDGYFNCQQGVGSFARCPPGFYFNEANQLCDFPENVFCHVCTEQVGVQLLLHPTQCNQFITCSSGVSFLGTCEAGQAFDVSRQACIGALRVNCNQIVCPPVDNPNVVVFIPGNQSCEEYFICQSGTPIQRFCAPGLHWNRVAERCDFPELAQCPL
ncbi:peritrophin-44-like [Anopheles cruzii]|uniref:peritrophin-44-like n=1 Tax=Anopheles cruzii TaxID=68878 RepID=UPI0022EC62CF|nr:peritrophin-44-like [Anopheles cruzii]